MFGAESRLAIRSLPRVTALLVGRSQWVAQHEVHLQELQKLESFARLDSNGTLPCLGLIDYSRPVRFSRGKYCRMNGLDGVASTH
jgi:hypothetical protein